MTDPWLVQSVEKNSDPEINETPVTLQNGTQQENKTLEEIEEEQDNRNENKQNLQFEDNFTSTSTGNNNNKNNNIESSLHQPLADSAAYLEGLEIKLKKLRKGSKLVESLSAKREDCMRTLLDVNTTILGQHDELNEPISNGDSAVHEIYRHLQPVQAVTVGELVHILKHDQLLTDNSEEEEENVAASVDAIEE